MIIGIDHGYGQIKTRHCAFQTGVTAFEYEPFAFQRLLEYEGRYLVCGSGRQTLRRDKTTDDAFFHLTLAAIAEELKAQDAGNVAKVTLAVGLPLTRIGREKASFREYLARPSPIEFIYERQKYAIHIDDVLLYPQGYAAVMPHIESIGKEPSLILVDVGSWTTDVMRIDDMLPNADHCRSLEMGMIRCIDEIQEQVRRVTGLSVTEAQIERALREEPGALAPGMQGTILEHGRLYARRLIDALLESGFDVRATPAIFLGGGAGLVRRYVAPSTFARVAYIESIHANAIGYEYIARQAAGRKRDG